MSHFIPAQPLEGGFYAGRILIENVAYALIAAPKALGERAPGAWNGSYKMIQGATSYSDGLANTIAMAEAGSELAQWALGLRIGGCSDYYIASQDELEIAYRTLKPGTGKNSLWGRSGINVSAIPPTYPYSDALPTQTENELFRTGGSEAFEEESYWTSTQHSSGSSNAWGQYFRDGSQHDWRKDDDGWARAFRRLPI